MKTPIIITFACSLLVCGGTVAIAVDQVKTRDGKIAGLRKENAELEKDLRAARAKRDQYQASTLDWMEKSLKAVENGDKLAATYQRALDATKAAADAREKRDALIIQSQQVR